MIYVSFWLGDQWNRETNAKNVTFKKFFQSFIQYTNLDSNKMIFRLIEHSRRLLNDSIDYDALSV